MGVGGAPHNFTLGVQRGLENWGWTWAKTSSWGPIQWPVGISRQCLYSFNENSASVNSVLGIVLDAGDAKISNTVAFLKLLTGEADRQKSKPASMKKIFRRV